MEVRISSCGVNGGLAEKSVPSVPGFVPIVVAAAPVRGSLACLDFFFFLVVAACPAAMVNRVLGHEERKYV